MDVNWRLAGTNLKPRGNGALGDRKKPADKLVSRLLSGTDIHVLLGRIVLKTRKQDGFFQLKLCGHTTDKFLQYFRKTFHFL